MDAFEMTLLFDYYGGLLTPRQRTCFDMRYNQDLSLGEIGQVLEISRQAVYDNLTRSEALLRKMEENTGCIRRGMHTRKVVQKILSLAKQLEGHSDSEVSNLAAQIIALTQDIEE